MSRSNILEVTNLSDLKEIMESCVTVILGFTTPETPKDLKVFIRKFLKRKAERFPLITFVYMEVSESDRKTLNILRGEPKDYPKIYHIRGGNNILVAVEAADEEKINESFAAAEQFYVKEMKAFQKKLKEETANRGKSGKTDEEDTPISDKRQEDTDDCEISLSDEDKPKKPAQKSVQKPTQQNPQGKKQPMQQPQDEPDDQDEEQETAQNRPKGGSGPNKQNSMAIQPEEPLSQLNPVMEKKKNLEKLVLLNKKSDEMKLDLIKDISKRKKLESIVEKKKEAEKKVDDSKEYRKSVRKTTK